MWRLNTRDAEPWAAVGDLVIGRGFANRCLARAKLLGALADHVRRRPRSFLFFALVGGE